MFETLCQLVCRVSRKRDSQQPVAGAEKTLTSVHLNKLKLETTHGEMFSDDEQNNHSSRLLPLPPRDTDDDDVDSKLRHDDVIPHATNDSDSTQRDISVSSSTLAAYYDGEDTRCCAA